MLFIFALLAIEYALNRFWPNWRKYCADSKANHGSGSPKVDTTALKKVSYSSVKSAEDVEGEPLTKEESTNDSPV